MNDFEMLICLSIWTVMVWLIFTMIKTGAVEKILEDFVNDIDPDVQRVTRCEKCKYYDKEKHMCCLLYDYESGDGVKWSTAPCDYCAFGEKSDKDG